MSDPIRTKLYDIANELEDLAAIAVLRGYTPTTVIALKNMRTMVHSNAITLDTSSKLKK